MGAPRLRTILALVLISGWPIAARAQAPSSLAPDGATLQKQVDSFEDLVKQLQTCVNDASFASKKELCQRALDLRKQQLEVAQEKLEVLKLRDDPSLLTENLKREASAKLDELDKRFASLSPGPTAPPVPPPGAVASPPGTAATAAPPTPTSPKLQEKKEKPKGSPGGDMLRTIVGFEQSGASSAESQQNFFFDVLYSRPVAFQCLWGRKEWVDKESKQKKKCSEKERVSEIDLGPRFRTWGNLRISSVPVSISTPIAQFATNFASEVGQLPVNKVARAFEFLGGLDIRLAESNKFYRSFDGKTREMFSLDLLLGGGLITPLSPRGAAQIFQVPANQPDFFTEFPQAQGKQFVVFAPPDRDRFFRQAYAGLRIATHFIEDNEQFPKKRFPATFDITYGFNESVTGGSIRGGVMRLDGFLPLPYSQASWIYLFGTGLFKPGTRAKIKSPFLLDPAPDGTLPTDPNAVVITSPQSNRDYYRIGFGFDFVDLVATIKASNAAKAAKKAASEQEEKENKKEKPPN